MNIKAWLVSLLFVGILAGCGGGNDNAGDNNNNENNNQTEEPATEAPAGEENTDTNQNDEETADKGTDVNTTASIVNDADAFVKAVSENGTWIIATLRDLNIDKDVVVAGEFHDKNDASKELYRKIAPYEQDENRNITKEYTITVPKMTIQSPNTKIAPGTIKGDVYVEVKGFNLPDGATIGGNIFYANEEVKDSAVIEGDITGTETVQ
ncbi:hypothetical protein R4Z10_10940 [Niallia sp. XMNu-256]|uniref:hypothetical protein n=1 Tax=Niallia sp. XMNu-256 TaxID=3082444 RepID=UPI0030CEF472